MDSVFYSVCHENNQISKQGNNEFKINVTLTCTLLNKNERWRWCNLNMYANAQKYDGNEWFNSNFCPTTYSWLLVLLVLLCILWTANTSYIQNLKFFMQKIKTKTISKNIVSYIIQIVRCLNLLIWPQFFFVLSFQSESANSEWIQMWIGALLQRLLIVILKFTFWICLLTHSALTIHIWLSSK